LRRDGPNLVPEVPPSSHLGLQGWHAILGGPAFAETFDVVGLSPGQLGWMLALAPVPFLAAELFKIVVRNRSPRCLTSRS
jgi:hypothetical protein